jgi:N-acetylneuraminic acid mutarotase
LSANPADIPVAAATSDRWITRANLWGTERWGLTTAVVRNSAGETILYAIGGRTALGTSGSLSKVQAYSVSTNKWTLRASLPVPLSHTNGAGVIDGKIYVSGGIARHNVYLQSLFVYDPATNKWTAKADMPITGYRGVTGVINGKLYVLTGCGAPDYCWPVDITEAFYRYDPVTDRWTALPIPSRVTPDWAHAGSVGGFIGGKFYVATPTSVHVYDPATNQWSIRTGWAQSCHLFTGLVFQSKLYLIGGSRLDPGGNVTNCETAIYDPATDTWTTGAAPPTIRSSASTARVVVNGQPRIHLVGGSLPGNNLQYVP